VRGRCVTPTFLILLLFLAMVVLLRALRPVREDERLLVFRLGEYVGVRGPGLVLLLPIVDSAVRVRLDEKVPGWRFQSPREVREQLDQLGRAWKPDVTGP
jgi:regulator of protease activity HflC (stomatin/prohibitin superfamily)